MGLLPVYVVLVIHTLSSPTPDLQWTEGDTARLTSNLKIHMQLYQQDMANVIQDEREKGKRRVSGPCRA